MVGQLLVEFLRALSATTTHNGEHFQTNQRAADGANAPGRVWRGWCMWLADVVLDAASSRVQSAMTRPPDIGEVCRT